MHSRILAPSVLSAAGLLLSAGTATAQCSVYRLNVPDFDQRRDPAPGIMGLPGNGGCYCVPTSVMNWFAYISNNGYPDLLNGPRNWQSNTHYNDVTGFLGLLGLPALMNTSDGVDPNGCGTNGTGFTNGARGWLDSFYDDEFVVFTVGPIGTDTLTPQDLYEMMAFGGLIAMSYSRWTAFPANVPIMGLPQRFVRQPVGHCVTLTRVTDACGPNPRVWYRDPAGFDGPDTDQSQFVTQISDLAAVPYFYAGDSTTFPILRTMWLFADISSNVSMLDSARVITPIHGLTASPQLGEVSIMGMWNFDDLTILPPTSHQIPGATSVVSLAMSPRPGASAAVLVRTRVHRLVMLESNNGAANPPESRPLADLAGPGPMVFDRNGRLHVYDNMALRRLDTTTSPATVLGATSLTRVPIAAAANDRAGEIVLLLPSILGGPPAAAGSVDEEGGGYMDEDFPPWCTVDPQSTIAVGPSGAIYVATPSTNSIYRLVRSSTGGFTGTVITHSSIVQPRNLHCTHRERLVFTSGAVGAPQTVVVLGFSESSGQWLPEPNARLAGQPAGPIFTVAISRQYRDDLIDIDTVENIPLPLDNGPGVPDCIADFDANGTVAVPDIFAYLSMWFSGDLLADVNYDDEVTVPDIFAFLSAWFAGCP